MTSYCWHPPLKLRPLFNKHTLSLNFEYHFSSIVIYNVIYATIITVPFFKKYF